MIFVIDTTDGSPGAIIPENQKFIGYPQIKIQVWRPSGPSEYIDATSIRLLVIEDLQHFFL